jgi:coniferyl-aldehyde dehydrogenase
VWTARLQRALCPRPEKRAVNARSFSNYSLSARAWDLDSGPKCGLIQETTKARVQTTLQSNALGDNAMNDLTFAVKGDGESLSGMQRILNLQKAAQLRDGIPSLETRINRLDRCIGLLVDHAEQIADALAQDFSCRPRESTLMTDVAASIGPLKDAKANVAKWMRPEKRKVSPSALSLLGAKAELRFQPKGTVGIIAPWNFPVNLTFGPLAQILAAGNRAMIKPSELTPATSDLLRSMFGKAFSEEEIAVFTGGPEVGQAFSRLAFDHLIFTGGTAIGRRIMMAAAENLVPVTLELGGKSPVVVGRSADITTTAERIMTGKTMNAGQICLAPDYLLVPSDKHNELVIALQKAVTGMFKKLRDNPDFTAIISPRHFDRITAMVEDARAKGATVIEINPADEDFAAQNGRKIPPTLILNPTDDMAVMQEEIFGPVLPVKTYQDVREAVAYINAHDRPLGLYYFGADQAEQDYVLSNTTSGGVTVNDVIFHIAMEDLPFGGIGPSGMGSYHGFDGFKEFSHKRSIYTQIKKDLGPMKALKPPYGKAIQAYLAGQIKR